MSDAKLDYWIESVEATLSEMGIEMTQAQINELAEGMQGSHECYSMAFPGADTDAYVEPELKQLREEKRQREVWESNSEPCKTCNTSGTVQDGWGRDRGCEPCGGKGRVRRVNN